MLFYFKYFIRIFVSKSMQYVFNMKTNQAKKRGDQPPLIDVFIEYVQNKALILI